MKARQALYKIVESSGKSRIQVSSELGRSRNYITNYFVNDMNPGADTLAQIADVCGWDMVLRNRSTGEEIPIGD